jgi:hypothetical protein
VAFRAAQEQIKSVAPDAVPVMVTSGTAVLTPPLVQWSVLFVSPSKNRIYNVPVDRGQAQPAQDLGIAAAIPKTALDAAVAYESLKIGSEGAYEKAKAELSKTGVPSTNIIESITLVNVPGLSESKIGVWEVAFLTGMDPKDRRTAEVDAMTGAVTETTPK